MVSGLRGLEVIGSRVLVFSGLGLGFRGLGCEGARV